MLSKITSVLAIAALICLGFWSLSEYRQQKRTLRVVETDRYIGEFESGAVADAWSRLRQVWDLEGSRRNALMSRFENGDQVDLPNYRYLESEVIIDNRLDYDIDVIIVFVHGLSLCVQAANCDGQRVSKYFGDSLWKFYEENFFFLNEERRYSSFGKNLQVVAPRPKNELEFLGS